MSFKITFPRWSAIAPCLVATLLASPSFGESYEDDVFEAFDSEPMEYTADGQPRQQYCVITIANRSSHNLVYDFKWKIMGGKGRVWSPPDQECTIHDVPCTKATQENMNVEFDYDVDEHMEQKKFYLLRSKLSYHRTCEDGGRYVFRDVKGKKNKVDLYKRRN